MSSQTMKYEEMWSYLSMGVVSSCVGELLMSILYVPRLRWINTLILSVTNLAYKFIYQIHESNFCIIKKSIVPQGCQEQALLFC